MPKYRQRPPAVQQETHFKVLRALMLSHINVGTGTDCTIRELAETIARVSGFDGELKFETSKPDGTPRKLMNVGPMHALGWHAQVSLEHGLKDAYSWYLDNILYVRG